MQRKYSIKTEETKNRYIKIYKEINLEYKRGRTKFIDRGNIVEDKTADTELCVLRNMDFEDIEPLVELITRQWSGKENVDPEYLNECLKCRIKIFKTGALVVERKEDSRIIGAINSLRTNWNDIPPTWAKLTANGTFLSHNENGDTLVCPQITVDSDCGLKGVSRVMIEQQSIIAKQLGCKHLIAYSRFQNYGQFLNSVKKTERLSPTEYLRWNALLFQLDGKCYDKNIGMHMSFGAKPLLDMVFEGGCPYDTNSRGCIIVMKYW